MQVMHLNNARSKQSIRVMFARTYWQRARGLLGRPAPAMGAGIVIDRCHAIHTVAMAYPIDVVFLDSEWNVIRMVRWLPPMRRSACNGARYTLEMRAGEIDRLQLRIGDGFDVSAITHIALKEQRL